MGICQRFAATIAALIAVVHLTPPAVAWPEKPVRFILSQPAGSSPDIAARLIAERLGRVWGQQVIIDNRPGGQNVIGAQAAARAPADGHSYYFATSAAIVTNPFMFKSLPYDPEKDFVPVAKIALSPSVIAVHPSLAVRNLAELVALEKAQPGKLAASNEGPKSFTGMVNQILNLRAGINLLQVTYISAPKAIQDALAGQIQVVIATSAAISPAVRRGDLRAIAVSSPNRMPGYDGVQTIAETYPGFAYFGWYGLFAPAGAPAAALRAANAGMDRVLKDPELVPKLVDLGLIVEGAGTLETAAAFVAAERALWQKAIKDVGIQPE